MPINQTLLIRNPSTGLPEIQRAAFYVMFRTLNDSLSLVQSKWDASDVEHSSVIGVTHVPTVLEPIQNKNFYEGRKPSLIDAEVDCYPNVCVMATRATPDADSALWDHQEKYRVSLTIEVMVKASAEEGEEVCGRRVNRMIDAVHTSMMTNQSLGGIVSGFIGAPTISVADIFTRKDRGGSSSSGQGTRTAYGPHWFWQGGRLEYAVRKEAATPSHGRPFRNAPTYSDLGIDQA